VQLVEMPEAPNPLLVYGSYLIVVTGVCVAMFLRKHRSQAWTGTREDFEAEFLKRVSTDTFWGRNQEICVALSKMLGACYDKKVVIIASGGNRFQMIQFGDNFVRFNGQPMIEIQRWGHTASLEKALDFLRKTKKEEGQVEIIQCSSEDVFRALFEHVAATCRSKGDVDPITGTLIYTGRLAPQKI